MNARILTITGAAFCALALGAPARLGADDQGTWSEFPPPRRQSAAAVYDPVRDRMLFFGGEYGTASSPETWELRFHGTPIWNELVPSGPKPSPRFGSSAIYDPIGDRVIVFGGFDGGFRYDAWSLELSGHPTWTLLTPAGTPPSGRLWHSAIYDPLRERMLVFGGQGTGGAASDVWELSLSGAAVWSIVSPGGAGPSALISHTALYDPVRDRMLVFGGSNGSTSSSSVWALNLAATPTWAQVLPSGTPPLPRRWHAAIYDPPRDRMLVFGGWVTFTPFSSGMSNDLRALSLAGAPAWTAVTADGLTPPPNQNHSAIYDPVRDRMVVHGGRANSGDAAVLELAVGPTWDVIASPGQPHPDYLAAGIYDSPRQRLLVAGGLDGAYGRVSAFALTGDPVWTTIDAAGVLPGPRVQHTVILDAPRDRMILFGGQDSIGIYHNDAWALSLGGAPSWTELVPSGSPPPPRTDHVAVYDPVRERMIVVGGQAQSGQVKFNDVWALSLSGATAWTQLFPSGAPPPGRTNSAAIYDPIRDRIILFGGLNVSSSGENDVWALSLSGTPTWTQLAPSGTPPSPRFWHRACYDAVRDRMVIFGGYSDRRDVWALNLAGTPTWVPLLPEHGSPPGRALHTLVYDADRDRMIVFGGSGGNLLKDVWSLLWGPPVGVPPETAIRRTELAPGRPVPARTTLTIPFSLSAAGAASLRVYDAGGRLVKSLENRTWPAGRHVVEWDLRDEAGVPIPSGIYFYELRSVESRSARRFVVLR